MKIITTAFILFLAISVLPANIFAQETTNVQEIQTIPQPQPVMPPQEIKQMPRPQQPQMPMPINIEEDKDERRDFVDPREIKEILRQIKDIKREAQRLIKKAKKINLSSEMEQLNAILSQVSEIETNIKNSSLENIERETLQEFYDLQAWEEINGIRIKIELPNEIKNIEKEIKRLEKIIGKKNFSIEGVNLEKIKSKIGEIKNAISQAKENLSQGNFEEAHESMQIIYEEGVHPGEIMGVLNRLSEMTKQLKRIKSEEIRNEIKKILAPVFEAVNSDDFREANMILNDVSRELQKIMESARTKPSINSNLRSQMQQLEEKIQIKMQQEKQFPEKERPQSYNEYKDMRTASMIESIKGLIGL